MRNKYLLGATKDNEIVFCEFEVTERNGYPEFSASFDTVRPFNGSDVDLEYYFEDYADPRTMDAEWIIYQCDRLHCCPMDLPRHLADECNDPRDAIDCSLYDKEFDIDGDKWYFESSCCGQHDTRDEMEIYINKAAYNELIELWDKYHLKKVSKPMITKKLKSIIERLEIVDEEEWIKNYIRETM